MDKDEIIIWGSIILFILLILSLVFIDPVFEARVYTRATGIEITYWEAFFTDLKPPTKIIEQAEQENK